ncbi:MAG: hypothetical protein CSA18_01980 [Deltaproteobacteria bacterium]|nr:MAG: hypothetical protein CSB21_01485 [Deltaproteobacteria bacterium]PIE74906.1 MAG: hypothetical protein CSA18_01980 [Deltaproteobacteria bacterium]
MEDFIVFSGKIYHETEICIIDIYKLFNWYSSNYLKDHSLYAKAEKIKPSDFPSQIFSAHEFKIINNFKTLKKQFEWISARTGLKHLVKKNFPYIPFKNIETEKEKNGAPWLKNLPFLNISISHSGRYAVAAINKVQKIGMDLEKLKDINTKHILYAGFSGREIKNLSSKKYNEILKLWTIKESYLKYIRKGFNESLKKVEIIKNKIYYKNLPVENISIDSFFLLDNYVLSFVCEKIV